MSARVVAGVALTAAAVLAAIILGPPPDASPRALVREMVGEHHYRVTLGGRVIGHYVTTVEMGETILLGSKLTAQLTESAPFVTEEQLRFSSRPPYALVSAMTSQQNHAGYRSVHVRSAREPGEPGSYVAEIDDGNGHPERRVMQWHYSLAEHLALETWLRDEQPPVNAQRRVFLLDFDRLMPSPETWRVVGVQDGEYTVTAPGPLDDTLIKLDSKLTPEVLSTAGLFTIIRTDSAAPAIDGRGLPAFSVALEQEIPQPDRVAAVTLVVNEAAARHFDTVPGTRIEDTGHGWLLHRAAIASRPATTTEADEALRESLTIPAAHPAILALAARVSGDSDRERVDNLTRLVHNHLSYNETTAGTLIDAVTNRQGDCTEFADLFTAVARAVGLPAVSVTGLTYSEVDGPGLYLHAWNEVVVDGEWVAVDPTWNLTRVDALHIPLPNSSVRFLAAYTEMNDMRFAVESVRYF